MDVFKLADRLIMLRAAKDEQSAIVKSLSEQIEEVENQMVEAMVQGEVQNFSRSGKLFHLRSQNYVSVRKDNKEQLNTWLRENGYETLIGESVHPATLKSFVGEMLEDSDELPDGLNDLVSIHTETKIGVRAAAK